MKTCPNCGVQNDSANRFCDQCGSQMEGSATPSVVVHPSSDVDQAARVMAQMCANCGAMVLPGEAFCDECGAPLMDATAPSADAPTMAAPPEMAPTMEASAAPSSSSGATDSNCPICGHQNMPGDRYCDNCGADLGDAPTAASPDPAMVTQAPVNASPPVQPASALASAPTASNTAAENNVSAVDLPPAPAGKLPPATDAAVGTAAPAAPAPNAAEERQRLTGLISAHRDTIAHYEQMLTRYPAGGAPAFLTAGLDEARSALAKAEAELTILPAGPDPAEITRLIDIAVAHRDTIAHYEQMLTRYPAGGAPAFLTAGLDEARSALAKAEAELAYLGVDPGTITAAPAAAAPAAAMPPPMAAPSPVPQPESPVAAASKSQTGPCLILSEGRYTLQFPTDKEEIIVGREDPVSNIFPEIDLTPYGGETGGVSRQHARITRSNGAWMVTDLNSTNFTRVDGNRLEPNIPVPIQNGSRLQFGRIVTVFHM
ncbi:MAG: zinc ribbon domain-containing protein [Chloroflexales bacterium]|nr:zinc ribbon domain-containing protein [Chloroflexales bacterium]